jgi:hypothetical protein
MIDPCCDPAAVETAMLQAEITGLQQQQKALGRRLESPRLRDERLYAAALRQHHELEIALVGKQLDLAVATGDHDTAGKWRGVLAEYACDQCDLEARAWSVLQ